MKLLKVGIAVVLGMSLGACSNSKNSFEPIKQALQKKDVKNLKPDRKLTPEQAREIDNWFTKDPVVDNAEGVSADKAYMDLNLPNKKEIIVAVVDSGVDITHPDLAGKIWINKGEIPANQIDDDKNGYVDDVYGWNFIGGHDANGKNVDIGYEQLEITRQLVKLQAKKAQGQALSDQEQTDLASYSATVAKAVSDDKQVLQNIAQLVAVLQSDYNILKDLLKVDFADMTAANVAALHPQTDAQKAAQDELTNIFTGTGADSVAKFQEASDQYSAEVNYNYNVDFQPRKGIVGDDPDDLTDVKYGNNDVTGPDANHGTHVSGIIAANRNNNIGINGVAQNVKIMVVRVVPNGDERDKDVALGIRYAVDNGANIINMSFGKAISPQKYFVGEAMKYAESKGVLLVHAAGNDSQNKDVTDNYPTRKVYDQSGKLISTVDSWLDVGASSQFKASNLPASFSDYGQTTVDLFAPGVNIKSTVMNNQYAIYSGTSMASPTTAGVAALVWSQRPDLTASQLKEVLLKTTRSRAGLLVSLPGTSQSVPFESLSITGGIVDAYAAIKSLMQ